MQVFAQTLLFLKPCWKQLVLTDIVYKIFALVLLTPLLGILFRVLLTLSGKTVLTDNDILYFFLGPLGWISAIAVGAVWLAIMALEQAALLGILSAAAFKKPTRVFGALKLALMHTVVVLQVTAKMVGYALLVSAPFLAAIGVVYYLLLSKFDINYYLTHTPSEFWIAVGIGGTLVIALAAIIIRMVAGWFFALPLVLFENASPKHALTESHNRSVGHRRTLVTWVAGWFVMTVLISSIASGTVTWIATLLIPSLSGTVATLILAVGIAIIFLALVNLLVSLLFTITFSVLVAHAYRTLGKPQNFDASKLKIVLSDVDQQGGLKITKTRLAVAGIIAVMIAFAVGYFVQQSVQLKDDTEITAHRGASASAPENTMAAVLAAIDERADWCEIDVQETADGQVVVFHDSDFKKLANVDLKIWDATIDQLKDIDIGSHFSPEFSDQRVPLLSDVLAACKGKIGVNIELKYYGHDDKLEQRVAEIVESHDMASDIVLMSLKRDGVKKMKALRPSWKVGLLTAVAAGDLTAIDVDFLAVNAGIASHGFVRSAQAKKRPVLVWTVNDPISMSTMMGRGVNGIITDKPELARKVLEERAKLGPTERLLLQMAEVFGVTPKFEAQ